MTEVSRVTEGKQHIDGLKAIVFDTDSSSKWIGDFGVGLMQ